MLRHMTSLHRVYAFYSRLGHQLNPDNAYVMTRMQFWRLLKDCQLHYQDYGLVDMDRWLGECCTLVVHVPSVTMYIWIFQSCANYRSSA